MFDIQEFPRSVIILILATKYDVSNCILCHQIHVNDLRYVIVQVERISRHVFEYGIISMLEGSKE